MGINIQGFFRSPNGARLRDYHAAFCKGSVEWVCNQCSVLTRAYMLKSRRLLTLLTLTHKSNRHFSALCTHHYVVSAQHYRLFVPDGPQTSGRGHKRKVKQAYCVLFRGTRGWGNNLPSRKLLCQLLKKPYLWLYEVRGTM